MNDMVQCTYSSCLHDSRNIRREDAVCVGRKYYHEDCYQTKEEIEEIVDLFVTHINPHPVQAQLQKVINNIIFKKGLGSNFLLFGLKYYIEHKIPLNYPQGLYYVVQNKDVRQAYEKKRLSILTKGKIVIDEPTESTFEYKPAKPVGFEDIIGKKVID